MSSPGSTVWCATAPSIPPRRPGRRHRRESATAGSDRWFVEPEVDGLDAEIAVAALERLPGEQSEVIVARHWGGLSFEQIAEVVGCSASTALRRYTAGVEDLRKQLGVTCPNRSSNALSRFTPDAGRLDRDALLFAAGHSSACPNRSWIALASLLGGTQALTLVLLWPHPAPPGTRSTLPVASVIAPVSASPANLPPPQRG